MSTAHSVRRRARIRFSGSRYSRLIVSLESVMDDLFGLPLDDFVGARNAAAKELRGAGRSEESEVVKSLPKPTLTAWAVNQLARRDAEDLGRLLQVRDELKHSTTGSELRSLSQERRALTNRLLNAARVALSEAGHPATPTQLERVHRTLEGGGTEEERNLLLSGRLSRELEPAGLEMLLADLPDAVDDDAEARRAEAKRLVEELAARALEAEDEAVRLERDAERASRAAETAAREASEARRRANELRRSADEAG
jgi:hypothetical protein